MVKVGLDFINETKESRHENKNVVCANNIFPEANLDLGISFGTHTQNCCPADRQVFAQRHCVRIHINTEILIGQSFFRILWFWVII